MGNFFIWLWDQLINNPVEWLAFFLSVVDFIILMTNRSKEKVKLKIKQIEDGYYFSYIFYKPYNCFFAKISIDNVSKSSTSISDISLSDSYGNKYRPTCLYHQTSHSSDIGILSLKDNSNDEYYSFDIEKDNILNNLRVESYGNISGYLYIEFDDADLLKKDEELFSLSVQTPKKCFTQSIIIKSLPKNYSPEYPVKHQCNSE